MKRVLLILLLLAGRLCGQGHSGEGKIIASDVDFEYQVVGSTSCDPKIVVRNVGDVPFTLLGADTSLTSPFKISEASLARLPVVLYPAGDSGHKGGDTIELLCCFTPNKLGPDSLIIHWRTDIPSPLSDTNKSWSKLSGFGEAPGISWSKHTRSDTISTELFKIGRVYLINNLNKQTTISKVFFSGPDSAEYHLIANQYGYYPLEGFPMNAGDTIWADYKWQPDITTPIGKQPRIDSLIATFDNGIGKLDSAIIVLSDYFKGMYDVFLSNEQGKPQIRVIFSKNELLISPFPMPLPSALRLYDLLGREIREWSVSAVTIEDGNIVLPLGSLSAGTYIILLEGDHLHNSIPVQIY